MNEILVFHSNLYQIPSETTLQNRREFYSTQKEGSEPIIEWFNRIKDAIDACDFGASSDFLTIDKFFCGLDEEAFQWFQETDCWSVDQLNQKFIDQNDIGKKEEIDSESEQQTDAEDVVNFEFNDVNTVELCIEATDPDENQSFTDSIKSEIKNESEKVSDDSPKLPNAKRKTKKQNSIKTKQKTVNSLTDADIRYHCSDCGKEYKSKAPFVHHQRLHAKGNLLNCKVCNQAFLEPCRLKRHFRKHEREKLVAGKTFECHLCKYRFLRVQGLRSHINTKHLTGMKTKFQCSYCNGCFNHQRALDNHLRSVHRVNIPNKCLHCEMEFDSTQDFKEHLKTHPEIKPFMCEVCGNAFKRLKQLEYHKAKHSDERRFKCAECGQMLKSRSNYKNHMKLHTGERPFACNVCDKTFVQRANYLKHLRRHIGERPHGCTYCEKRFMTNYDVKLHINSVHTGAKPFVCDVCDRKFAQPSTLRVHKKIHQ